jgi:hypothetical protein
MEEVRIRYKIVNDFWQHQGGQKGRKKKREYKQTKWSE